MVFLCLRSKILYLDHPGSCQMLSSSHLRLFLPFLSHTMPQTAVCTGALFCHHSLLCLYLTFPFAWAAGKPALLWASSGQNSAHWTQALQVPVPSACGGRAGKEKRCVRSDCWLNLEGEDELRQERVLGYSGTSSGLTGDTSALTWTGMWVFYSVHTVCTPPARTVVNPRQTVRW